MHVDGLKDGILKDIDVIDHRLAYLSKEVKGHEEILPDGSVTIDGNMMAATMLD